MLILTIVCMIYIGKGEFLWKLVQCILAGNETNLQDWGKKAPLIHPVVH